MFHEILHLNLGADSTNGQPNPTIEDLRMYVTNGPDDPNDIRFYEHKSMELSDPKLWRVTKNRLRRRKIQGTGYSETVSNCTFGMWNLHSALLFQEDI
jgi:hypothetical protein